MKKSKLKATILLLLTAIQFVSVAQNCKYDYDKEDPISGQKEQRIKFNCTMVYTFAFYRNGNDHRVESYIMMPGEQNFVLPEGSKIDIKLSNKKVLTLASAGKAAPETNIYGSTVRTSYSMSYSITSEQLTEIQNNGIVFIRTYLQNGTQWYDHELKDKKIQKTKEAAGCMQ